jgi:hypothetical protein
MHSTITVSTKCYCEVIMYDYKMLEKDYHVAVSCVEIAVQMLKCVVAKSVDERHHQRWQENPLFRHNL